MRISRAIDRFLDQKQLEDDFTARSLESYLSVLGRLVDAPPRGFGLEARMQDFDGRDGTEQLRAHIGHNWGKTSTGRRANVISVHHSFWSWAFDEGFMETDPSARIKRPPRRKAVVYRPPAVDVELAMRATTLHERAAWVLMRRVGLRAATVCAIRWANIDLRLGKITVPVKGGHVIELPLSPVAQAELQDAYRRIEPDWDDHVFTIEVHRFIGNRRVVKVRDPKQPAKPKALWAMVGRVCKRAGVRPFGPHALRHTFATEYLRASGRDMVGLKGLLGHSSIQTTEGYGDALALEELGHGLARAFPTVTSVASMGDTDDPEGRMPLDALSGPGRNRTCGLGAPADAADADRADDTSEPRPNDRKERH